MIPLVFLAGTGVDYGQASRLRGQLQSAVDGIALTLCQTPLTTTRAELEAKAQSLLGAYMPGGAILQTPLPVTAEPRQITVSATAQSTTAFARLAGINTMDVNATTRCATPMPQTFEIALVLDTTGSMANSDGTSSKLASAKTAALNFVTYVKSDPAFDPRTRISIVPFASTVALDPTKFNAATPWIDGKAASSYHWTNINVPAASLSTRTALKSRFDIFANLKARDTSWDWAGCFENLPYPLNVSDGAPTAGNPDSYYVPMLAPDEPGPASVNAVEIIESRRSSKREDTYTDLNPSTQYYANSYLNDSNDTTQCPYDWMTAQTAEARACKYTSISAHASTSRGYFGIPNGPNFSCTSKPLERLTTDKTTLENKINSLTAIGNTNIFDGMMWGWRTLSPVSVFADGAPYHSKNVRKVIILMTDGANIWTVGDGLNFNESVYSSFGYVVNADGTRVTDTPGRAGRLKTGAAQPTSPNEARAALDNLTLESCTNARTSGISVYTIGFSVPSDPIGTTGLNLLRDCASTPSQAFVANSADSLIASFQNIAKNIGELRLTQ